jgi:DUF1009 family protein
MRLYQFQFKTRQLMQKRRISRICERRRLQHCSKVKMVLGVIAGRGALPILLLNKAIETGTASFVALLDGFADAKDFHSAESSIFRIGEVKKIIDFFKQNNVTHIVFAGKVDRPKWSDLYVDSMGGTVLARILKNKFIGDDNVMKTIALFVEELGFSILSPLDILQGINNSSILTILKPSEEDLRDIELGLKVSKMIGEFDIGQAVVVENGYVLGVEAAEGTDGLIKRCGALKRNSDSCGVLIKTLKPQQSIKLDPPVVGITTIQNIAKSGLRGIAVEKSSVIILEIEKVINLANQLNIFISII